MRRLISIAAAAGLLAACSLGPAYNAPKVDIPTKWQASGEGTGAWPDAAWWHGFGSSELSGLIEDAGANNYDLKAAWARILQAQAQAKIAGAALYPSLTLGASVTRDRAAKLSSSGKSPSGTTTYEGTALAAYEVDLFGQNRAAADAASTRIESSVYDRETVAIALVANVATTYFQILSLRDRIRLAEDTLKNAAGILDLLEQQRGIGTVSDLEVAQQRSAVATEQATIPALRLTERQSLNALALLVGRNPEAVEIKARSLREVKLPTVAAGLPSALLERRPDVRKAEADLRAANLDTATARAARFPTLQLTAEGGTASLALSGLFGPQSFLYNLASSLTAPIFEGGRLEGQEQFSKARFQELLENYRQAIISAFRDVEDGLSGVEENAKQFAFDREAYEQAREAYRLADLRYRAGTTDFLTVLEAQRTVFQAEDVVSQIDFARFGSLVAVYKALGGGWDGKAPPAPSLGSIDASIP